MSGCGVNIVTQPSSTVPGELGRLRETIGQVIGSVFFGTLLKTMRESSFKGQYGHGGRGEEVFAAQLHGLLAERMGTTAQNGLADVLYDRLGHQQRIITGQRTGE